MIIKKKKKVMYEIHHEREADREKKPNSKFNKSKKKLINQ